MRLRTPSRAWTARTSMESGLRYHGHVLDKTEVTIKEAITFNEVEVEEEAKVEVATEDFPTTETTIKTTKDATDQDLSQDPRPPKEATRDQHLEAKVDPHQGKPRAERMIPDQEVDHQKIRRE